MRFFGIYTWLAALTALALGCSSSEVSRQLGARCSSVRECDELCLTGNDYPDGFCSTRCESDDDCPADARCARQQGGRCLFRCSNDDDCAFLGSKWDCENEPSASGRVCRGD
jgi:hypothetical protein